MNDQDTLASASDERASIAASIESALEVFRKEQSKVSAEIRTEQAALRAELKSNTEVTAQIKERTEDLIGFFEAAKGGLKVLGWFGTAIKWLGGISAACVGIYALYQAIIHGGMPPK